MIKRKASDIKHDLEAWWSTAGRDLIASGQAQDPEPDSDDDLPEEPAAQESEEKDPLVESIEATQAGMKLDAELTQLAEDPDFKGLDEKPTEKPDPIEADSDESDQEEAWIKDLDPDAVSTLKDVLDQAKMATFTCQTDDHEGRMLRRVRQLSGPMRNFVAKVRIHEGILSRATVMNCKAKCNKHQQYEHALALARAAFQCSAQRQSRFSLWTSFASRVLQDIKVELEMPDDSELAALKPEAFHASTEPDKAGDRSFQLLVVRPLNLGLAEIAKALFCDVLDLFGNIWECLGCLCFRIWISRVEDGCH